MGVETVLQHFVINELVNARYYFTAILRNEYEYIIENILLTLFDEPYTWRDIKSCDYHYKNLHVH